MAFDRAELAAAVEVHGRVARVVVARVDGSAPREVGAAMLVWDGGQSGTIGGGELEFRAAKAALAAGGDRLSTHPLGPELGQCCGGAVTLLTEIFDQNRVNTLPDGVYARGAGDTPIAVTRALARFRNAGALPEPHLVEGWFIEPIAPPPRHIWIWGAGHVGRALVAVLAPLPGTVITWIDTAPDRFPSQVPKDVTTLPAARPEALVPHAPAQAEHLIVTFSHALDLALCHALLGRGFGFCGLIGSATKWARFRNRLRALGHSESEITRITCPIGQKSLGKHPQAIAVGVAAALLDRDKAKTSADTG
jgi:xanthine dehydrogenase accessory factor